MPLYADTVTKYVLWYSQWRYHSVRSTLEPFKGSAFMVASVTASHVDDTWHTGGDAFAALLKLGPWLADTSFGGQLHAWAPRGQLLCPEHLPPGWAVFSPSTPPPPTGDHHALVTTAHAAATCQRVREQSWHVVHVGQGYIADRVAAQVIASVIQLVCPAFLSVLICQRTNSRIATSCASCLPVIVPRPPAYHSLRTSINLFSGVGTSLGPLSLPWMALMIMANVFQHAATCPMVTGFASMIQFASVE